MTWGVSPWTDGQLEVLFGSCGESMRPVPWLCVCVFTFLYHWSWTWVQSPQFTHADDLWPSWRSGTCWSCGRYGQKVERVFFKCMGRKIQCDHVKVISCHVWWDDLEHVFERLSFLKTLTSLDRESVLTLSFLHPKKQSTDELCLLEFCWFVNRGGVQIQTSRPNVLTFFMQIKQRPKFHQDVEMIIYCLVLLYCNTAVVFLICKNPPLQHLDACWT